MNNVVPPQPSVTANTPTPSAMPKQSGMFDSGGGASDSASTPAPTATSGTSRTTPASTSELDDHIQKMRNVARAAVHMMNKADAEDMAASVTEDIVIKTLTMVRDYPAWVDQAWKRALIHSPTPRSATPPPKKARKRHTPQQGSGDSSTITL